MFPNADVVNRINIELQKLGIRGVTVLAASGDGGSHFSFQKYSGKHSFFLNIQISSKKQKQFV